MSGNRVVDIFLSSVPTFSGAPSDDPVLFWTKFSSVWPFFVKSLFNESPTVQQLRTVFFAYLDRLFAGDACSVVECTAEQRAKSDIRVKG